MKVSALKISISTLALGMVFLSHFEPGAFDHNTEGTKNYHAGREVIERLGPQDDKLMKELEQLEQHVLNKEDLTLDEYQTIQGQLDRLLQRANEDTKSNGTADAELFGEILGLQEVVVGLDVR